MPRTSPAARVSIVAIMVLAVAAALTSASLASAAGVRVHVTPPSGSPSTRFTVSFRAPERTGHWGVFERHYQLTATAPKSASGCVLAASATVPVAPAGAEVSVTLDPAREGGSWCAGTTRGEIDKIEGPYCRKGQPCPEFATRITRVARFSFRVSATGDRTPPTFAGLQAAIQCLAGPALRDAPVRLTWKPARDDVTPPSAVVYDIYMASTPGGEAFSDPNWTTPPGATSFITPSLSPTPLYFVVRARDQAGNEDHNRVERRAENPCVGAAGVPGRGFPGPVAVHVTPRSGFELTRFVVGFKAPERTGRLGTMDRRDILSVTGPNGASNCVSGMTRSLPASPAGAQVRVKLDPVAIGGVWCTGTYHGEINEIQGPDCPQHKFCPAYVILRGLVGRFTFAVKPSTDTTPPGFAGLTNATQCAAGPVFPHERRPVRLGWTAASDDVTPTSEIVYDIFMSSTPGGENFSKPAWSTRGVTSFTTPSEPLDGVYFVVRARDQAGNADHNRVERRAQNLCV